MSLFNAPKSEAISFLSENIPLITFSAILTCCLVFLRPPELKKPIVKTITIFSFSYMLLPTLFSYQSLFLTEGYQTHVNQSRAMRTSEYLIDLEHIALDIAWRLPIVESIIGILHTAGHMQPAITKKKTTHWLNVKQKDNVPNLLVLVIGESMRADHLALYGYSKPTTPQLSLLTDELNVYKNAYSAGTSTWNSVPAALTWNSDISGPDLSIIKLAQAVGYKVHWLSNQRPYETWGITVTAISKQADIQTYISKNASSQQLDGALLPYFDKILEERNPEDKDLLIVHLYGSHLTFSDRYPQDFDIFQRSNYMASEAAIVPPYDNSILYTDYILSRLISKLKPFGGGLIFFADHGLADKRSPIPLKHDVRANVSLNSLHVPLLTAGPNRNTLPDQSTYSLYYFPCLFSAWSGIEATQLGNADQCTNALSTDIISYLGADLTLKQVPAPNQLN
tara:strand:- start:423 stop:1775 length:1353 start_codon:yes stop_codon:yes gene_type:complete